MDGLLNAYLASRPKATERQLVDYLFFHHYNLVKTFGMARDTVRAWKVRYGYPN